VAQRTASTKLPNSAKKPSPVLYDTAPVLNDLWVDELAEVGRDPLVRPFLIRSHQPRVTRHIGGENGSKTAFQRLLRG
jgi:hypothetical protein